MKKLTFLSAILLTSNLVFGQIIHVPDDYSSIQEGINAAEDGDTVLVAEDTYYENINFIGKAILVASEFILDGDTNHIVNTIINGSQPVNPDIGSVVTLISGEDSTSVLCGFTITGGTGTFVAAAGNARAGGGVFISESGGKLLNNHIEYNIVTNTGWVNGGGISAAGPDVPYEWVVLRNNRIYNNKAISSNDFAGGGGVTCYYNLIMNDNQISYNSAEGHVGGDGGGVAITGGFGPIIIDIRRNEITNNEAVTNMGTTAYDALGGGMGIYFDVTGNISNNVISFNSLKAPGTFWSWGPGVFIQDITSNGFVFENNRVCDNYTITTQTCRGGGVSLLRSGGIYQNNVLQNNSASHGGGIGIVTSNEVGDTAILINNTITGNVATYGGGIYLMQSKSVVLNSIIWGNDAVTGPSIYQTGSTLEVRYSDVEGADIWPGEGNLNCSPSFLGDGYHLDEACQLVNAGIESIEINSNIYECPPYDIDGDVRPYANTQPEIGADEVDFATIIATISAESRPLILYPNPAKDNITISSSSLTGNTQLSIFNVSGEKVIERQLINIETPINVSALPPGVYFVRLQNEKMVEVGKIVKE